MRRNRKKGKKQIAPIVKQRLVFLIAFLSAIITVLIFRVGEKLWPGWMVEYRSQILAILLLAVVVLISLSPVIIESYRTPRVFPGPGKNPYIDQ